jgi:hypothetical protein
MWFAGADGDAVLADRKVTEAMPGCNDGERPLLGAGQSGPFGPGDLSLKHGLLDAQSGVFGRVS